MNKQSPLIFLEILVKSQIVETIRIRLYNKNQTKSQSSLGYSYSPLRSKIFFQILIMNQFCIPKLP